MTDYLLLNIAAGDCNLYIVQTHRGHDGIARRASYKIKRHKGFGLEEVNDIGIDKDGLLIPCDRTVTGSIRDFLDLQRRHVSEDKKPGYQGPYYITTTMTPKPEFEAPSDTPPLFGGPYTAYKDRVLKLSDDFEDRGMSKNKEGVPLARSSCWTAAQGITQYIGGVDLSLVHPELATSYRSNEAAYLFYTKLYSNLKENTYKHYTSCHNIGNSIIAQKHDGPPFMLIPMNNGFYYLSSVLSSPLPDKDGMTVANYFESRKCFTSTPLARHKHIPSQHPVS